ncbi:MAG: hypothetical protein HKN00_10600 [Flavobacteriaceae bacterium]|nr:hypothetical protein [Bacteroidia bacterium]MBT8288485.1 hypothetical protein [Bacteroidia bacterium]NNF75626.1 hypothetical protein [Flavobacteriaceae bacterium]NNK71614.1 hypothetical protein [Flavobacteriaceae bacterium]
MKKINFSYALGEILIVIVGITIAFSLNKCAENSKNYAEKIQYLNNLKRDVLSDKTVLEENVDALAEKIALSGTIAAVLGTDSEDKLKSMGNLFQIAELSGFEPKDITYQTLINSGDLKLLDDFDLRAAIEEHYSNYKIMLKAYARQENIHKEYLGHYLINNVDYEAFGRNEFGFKKEALLKNIVQSMRGSFGIKLRATQKGIESCDRLLEIIDTSL